MFLKIQKINFAVSKEKTVFINFFQVIRRFLCFFFKKFKTNVSKKILFYTKNLKNFQKF